MGSSLFGVDVPLSGDYAVGYGIKYFNDDGGCLGEILFVLANTGFDLENSGGPDGGGPDTGGPDTGGPDPGGPEK